MGSAFGRTHELRLLIVVAVLAMVLSFAAPGFFTLQNVIDLLTSYAFTGILAVGLLIVLISGKIDISFTATASVAQYAALTVGNAYPGIGTLGVFALAALIGILLGLVNAALVSGLNMSSIIVTIATLNIFYGLLIFVTGGKYIFSLAPALGRNILGFPR
jgi:simple sugar transport system permease protein